MKKLIILLMVLLPLGVVAQELKMAHVNYNSVLSALPEIPGVEKALSDLREMYDKELKTMNDEYTKKYEEFVRQQDELTENIKLRRMQEIQDLQERMENVVNVATQDIQQKQQELIQPLHEKVTKAIQQVAEENKYSYVADTQYFIYVGNNAIDATEQVRKKLGL